MRLALLADRRLAATPLIMALIIDCFVLFAFRREREIICRMNISKIQLCISNLVWAERQFTRKLQRRLSFLIKRYVAKMPLWTAHRVCGKKLKHVVACFESCFGGLLGGVSLLQLFRGVARGRGKFVLVVQRRASGLVQVCFCCSDASSNARSFSASKGATYRCVSQFRFQRSNLLINCRDN